MTLDACDRIRKPYAHHTPQSHLWLLIRLLSGNPMKYRVVRDRITTHTGIGGGWQNRGMTAASVVLASSREHAGAGEQFPTDRKDEWML
jgi:hypothetical protein